MDERDPAGGNPSDPRRRTSPRGPRGPDPHRSRSIRAGGTLLSDRPSDEAPPELTLRPATPEDRPALEIIRRQAIEDGFSDVYPRDDFADLVARPHPDLADWIGEASVRVRLLETSITPVGFGAYHVGRARLLALYVSPEHQRRGLASRLLKGFLEDARSSGHRAVSARVPRNAAGFFGERGFETVDEIRCEDLTLLEMRRAVTAP